MWQGRSIEDLNKIVAKVLEDVHKLYQERGRIAPRNSGPGPPQSAPDWGQGRRVRNCGDLQDSGDPKLVFLPSYLLIPLYASLYYVLYGIYIPLDISWFV